MKLRSLLLAVTLVACDGMMGKPSKMASGELVETGDSKYDPWLKKVHEEQVAAGNWAEESKAARKPITTALNIPAHANNSAILSATREAKEKKNASLQGAAEETASLVKVFIEKQRTNAERLDKLAIDGVELKKQATEDRRNMAADKADPAKVEQKENVKHEVSAAVDVAADLRDDAKKGVSEGEKLIEGLKKELGISGDAPAPKKDKEEPSAKKEEPAKKADPKKPAAKKPPPTEAKPAEEKPAPAPAKKPPAEKPPDEVFNP